MASANRSGMLWMAGLVALLVLVTALSTLLQPAKEEEVLANRSVYNYQTSGIRAWFLALQKSGLIPTVWKRSFNELDALPTPAIMLMIEPYAVSDNSTLFAPHDSRKLLSWAGRGNTLIVFDTFNRGASRHLLRILNVNTRLSGKPEPPQTPRLKGTSAAQTATAPTPVELAIASGSSSVALGTYVSAPIVTRSRNRLDLSGLNPAQVYDVLLRDENNLPVMVKIRYGEGWVILATAPDLVSNTFLNEPGNDNYQFAANLVTLQQRPLFINEHVHGLTEAADVFGFYNQKTPLGKMFLQLIFAFAFVLWLSFRPWKPRQRVQTLGEMLEETERPVDLRAFIESLAGVYYKTKSAPLAVEPQLRRIETLLQRRYDLTLADTAALENLLASRLAGGTLAGSEANENPAQAASRMLSVLRRASEITAAQQRLPHKELLRLIQQLIFIEEQLTFHAYPGRITGTTRTGRPGSPGIEPPGAGQSAGGQPGSGAGR